MVGRRAVLTSIGVAITGGLAGCAATQDEFEFASEPGAVADSAVEEASYEELEREEIVETRTVEAGGSTRDVTVTNYAQPYKRQVEIAGQSRTLAAVAVFTTPSISFLGQQYNPIADESNEDLVERARSRISDEIDGGKVEDVTKEEDRSMTILDEETTVGVFSATTTVQGAEIDLRIHVTKVKHEGDFVLVAGGYPQQLTADEEPRLETMFNNVEHEGDE